MAFIIDMRAANWLLIDLFMGPGGTCNCEESDVLCIKCGLSPHCIEGWLVGTGAPPGPIVSSQVWVTAVVIDMFIYYVSTAPQQPPIPT